MKFIKQILIIAKIEFKNWSRYPENTFGTLLYIFIVAVAGYVFSLSQESSNVAVAPYYAVGLLVYLLLNNQNAVYLEFGTWKEEILSKPITSDVFLVGSFLGNLFVSSLPSLVIFIAVFIIYPDCFIINSSILALAALLGILSSIGISYIFAGLGLKFRPEGMIVTSITLFLSIFSGVMIPVLVLPEKVRIISYIIPYTWAIDLFRYSLLGTKTILPIGNELKYLLLSVLVTIVFGKFYLHYVMNAIKKKKVIIR